MNNRPKFLKRLLCIILSSVLVVSLISISEPNSAQANGNSTGNLVTNCGFDTTDNWTNASDAENPVAVVEQTKVADKEITELITNGDFENTGFDYTSLWGSNAGSLGVVTESDNRVLKAGTFANENILYVQSGMTPGETYKIRFKIKGSNNISYHLFCGDTGLSNATVVQAWNTATTDWTVYENTYTVPSGNAGHLVIQNVGGNGDLYIDDVSVTQEKEKTETTECITNGDFENNEFDYTSLWGRNAGSLAVVEDAGNRVLKAGTFANENILYVQSGMTPGETYKIRFKIKGSNNISYHLFCGDTGLSSAAVVQDWQTAMTEWTTYEKTYTVPAGNAGHLVIQNVGGNGDLYIDDFSVSLSKTAYTYSEGIGNCDGAEPDKVLVMENMTKVSQSLHLESGKSYQFSFKVKGEDGADATVTLATDATDVEVATPTSQWQDVSGTFTVESETHTISLKRQGTGKVFIDDVVIKEAESEEMEQVEISFDKYEGGWYFTVDDISKIAGGCYRIPVKIDGNTTTDIIIEYPQSWYPNGLAVWSFTNFGGTTPETSFEIAENAIMTPCDGITGSIDTSRKAVMVTNQLKVIKKDGVWMEGQSESEEMEQVEISFDKYEGGWYFTVDDISKIEGGYYRIPVKIDGNTTTDIIIEYPQSWYPNGLAVRDFTNFGGTTPETSFEIAENAIMTPYDVTTGAIDTSRKAVMVTNQLKVVKKDGVWMEGQSESEEMEQVEISFDKYEGGWYFTVDDISKIEGGYYRIPVKIDGNTTTDIIIEYPQSWYPNGLAVWSFTNFGGTTPETSFEIAENAIMTPCDGITGSIDTSRKAVMVTNQLKVVKKDGVWMESASAENQEETVIAIGECAFNNGDVFSAKITNLDAVKATRWYSAISTENSRTWGQVTGTIEADGEEQTMVVAFPGNGEVFFYLDGANKTLLISKNMKFSSANGKYIIQFTKNYEIDLVNNLVFEQGKRPVEKKAVNLKLGFDRLVNESFMFSYELFNGQRPQAGYYRTEAVIDGKETQVLMEYYPNDDAFFIYPNCFNATPVDGKEGYPAKRFELKKGAVLTPIIVGTWSKNVNGQPYQLSEGVSIVKDGTTWMDVDYFEYIKNAEPLNVKIVFERVKGRAAIMRVVTPDGQSIDSIYGDWTTARGNILRGIMNTATGAYTYENELAAYSITGNTFYIDGLRLNELDGLQIDAGTILYPDSTCKSNIPIKIVNQLRIIRDENDEWQVDKSFTTDYDLVDVNAASNGTQGNSDSSESSDEADKKNDDTKLSGTDKEDNSYNLSNILFHSDSKDVLPTSGKTVSTYIWVIILIAVIVPAAGVGLFVFKDRKKKIKQED